MEVTVQRGTRTVEQDKVYEEDLAENGVSHGQWRNRITWDKAYEAKIFHLQAHFLTIGGAQLDRGKCGADWRTGTDT